MASESDISSFMLSVNRDRLAYLLNLRLRGHEVSQEQISALRAEIREATGTQSPLVEELKELQDVLALIDGEEMEQPAAIKATLRRAGYIRLVMRPERNHARPHFHIEYKREHAASYDAASLEKLAGSMPSKYERPMLAWAKDHTPSLIETWGLLNAGDDVRELVVVQDA